jgi:hypothetical protein
MTYHIRRSFNCVMFLKPSKCRVQNLDISGDIECCLSLAATFRSCMQVLQVAPMSIIIWVLRGVFCCLATSWTVCLTSVSGLLHLSLGHRNTVCIVKVSEQYVSECTVWFSHCRNMLHALRILSTKKEWRFSRLTKKLYNIYGTQTCNYRTAVKLVLFYALCLTIHLK